MPSPKIYFIPGLGTDARIFINLKSTGLEFEVVEFVVPDADETFETYLTKLANKIDTSRPFILGGVSFGGMCAQSLAPLLHPEKMILISTIRSANQFPGWIQLIKKLPYFIHSFYNGNLLKFFARIALPLRSNGGNMPDGKPFRGVIDDANPWLVKWQVMQVMKWQNPGGWDGKILHLHGNRDQLFPIRKIPEAIQLNNGNHLIIARKANEIAENIRAFIAE